MSKKRKKQAWEIVIKDRFLTDEKPDNPYLTALLYFVVFFLSFLLIFVSFFQLCEIRGRSMENTIHNRDYVLLLKTSDTYKRGDIVVITIDKEQKSENIIKRIIAVGGDEIYFDLNSENSSIVDLYLKKSGEEQFTLLEESYIAEPMKNDKNIFNKENDGFNGFGEENKIKIDEGYYYAMGDNRNDSSDSREKGQFYKTNIYSKSVLIVEKDSILEKLLSILYHGTTPVSEN